MLFHTLFLHAEGINDEEESCTCSVLLFVAGLYKTLQLIKMIKVYVLFLPGNRGSFKCCQKCHKLV